MRHLLPRLRPPAAGREVIVSRAQRRRLGEPPLLGPGRRCVARLPAHPAAGRAVESRHQPRQIIRFDRRIVVGVQLVAIGIGVQEQHPIRPLALLEDQYGGLHP